MSHKPPTEIHPLKPFLPRDAKILLLGSFPPQQSKWGINFYYPNFQNDMWRIMGVAFFGNKEHFLNSEKKAFDKQRIVQFLTKQKIAVADMGYEIIRHKGNASDNFLEIVTPLNIQSVLLSIPECRTLAPTGKKAYDTLKYTAPNIEYQPPIGDCIETTIMSSLFTVYRMPSSSRAYPKPLHEKADMYKKMFREIGIL